MRILIIEDDQTSAKLLAYLLSDRHEIKIAASEEEAISAGQQWKPQLIISDWDLKEGGDGVVACREITKDNPAKVIITSGSPLASLDEIADLLAPWQVMSKPLEFERLFSCLQRLEQEDSSK